MFADDDTFVHVPTARKVLSMYEPQPLQIPLALGFARRAQLPLHLLPMGTACGSSLFASCLLALRFDASLPHYIGEEMFFKGSTYCRCEPRQHLRLRATSAIPLT